MDPASLASALIGAQIGRVQMAAAAKMLRIDADAAGSIVQAIEAAQSNMKSLANVVAGIGENLDIAV
jgi:uncharacterized alpha-E superfamily protein